MNQASAQQTRRTLVNLLFASFGYVALRVLIAPIRIKLLTSLLSKEDYGLLTLVMLTVSFITLISSMGSLEFMLRRIPGREPAFQWQALRTVATYFGWLALVLALLGVGAWMLHPLPKVGLSTMDLVACGFILVLTVHLTQVVYFLMGCSRYAQSRMLMLVYADGWFLPLLVMMWWMRVDVSFMLWLWAGWLLFSLGLAQTQVSLVRLARTRPSPALFRDMLVFGLPLLPMIMGEWIFQVQDRYVLLGYTDLVALANYTLCFNIAWVGVSTGASMLDVLVTEFYKARNRVPATAPRELAGHPELRRAFTLMLRYGLALALPIVVALAVARRSVILLLSDPKFADAADLMLWVAPLPLLYILVIIAGRTLMAIDRGTRVGVTTLIAAAVHLSLSIVLAPEMGARGVALAGCLAYGLLGLALAVQVRLWAWIEWRELRPFRLGLMAGLCGLSLEAARRGLPDQHLLILILGGLATLAALFGLGLIRRSDLKHFTDSMHTPSEPEEAALQEPFARD